MTDSVTSEDALSTGSTKITPISTDADIPTQVSEIIDRVEKQQGSINHIRKTVRMLRDRVTMPDGLPQGSTNPLSAKEQNEALSKYVDRTTFKNQMKQIAIKMDEISRYQKGHSSPELETKIDEALKQINQQKEKIDHINTNNNQRFDAITAKMEVNVSETAKAITQLKNGIEDYRNKSRIAIETTIDITKSDTDSVKASLADFKKSQLENFKKVNTTILQLKAEINKLKQGGSVQAQGETADAPKGAPPADLTDIITRLDKIELSINSKTEELSLRIEQVAQEVKNDEKTTEDLSTKINDFETQYSLDCEQRREHDTEIDTELSKVKLSVEAAETEIKNQAEVISRDFDDKLSKQHMQIADDQNKRLDEQKTELENLIKDQSSLDSLKKDLSQQLDEMKNQMQSTNIDQLKSEINQQLEEQKKQIESLSNDNSKIDQLKSELNGQIENLKKQIESLNSTSEGLESLRNELSAKIEILNKQVESQNVQITNIASSTSNLEVVQTEIKNFSTFQTEITQKVKEIENSMEDKNDVDQKLDNLKTQLTTFINKKMTNSDKSGVEDKLSDQKAQIDRLVNDKTKLEMLNKIITGQINDIKNEMNLKYNEFNQKIDLLTTQVSNSKGTDTNEITSDAVMMLQDQISALRRDSEKHKDSADNFIKQMKSDIQKVSTALTQKVDLSQSEQIHSLFESQIQQVKEDVSKQINDLRENLKSASNDQIDNKEFQQLKEKVEHLGSADDKYKEFQDQLRDTKNDCEEQVNKLKSIYETSVTEIKSIYKQSITDIKTTAISKIENEMNQLATEITNIKATLDHNAQNPPVVERAVNEIDERDAQIHEIQNQIEEMKNSQEKINEDIQALKTSSENQSLLNDLAAKVEKLKSDFEESKKASDSSNQTNQESIQSLRETIDTINTKVEQVSQLTEKITQIEKETNTVQSYVETVNTINTKIEQLTQLNEKVSQFEKEINTVQTLSDTVNTINTKIEQLTQLNEKVSKFEKEINTIQTISETVNTLNTKVQQIDQINEQITAIEKELNTIQTLNETVNSFNSKFDQLNLLNDKVVQFEQEANKIQPLSDTVNSLTGKVEQFNQMTEKITQIEKETNTVQSYVETINTINTKIEQLTQLNEKVSQFEKEINTVQTLSETVNTINTKVQQIDQINERMTSCEKQTKTIQTLTNSVFTLNEKVSQLEKELQEKLSEVEASVTNVQTRSINLEEEVATNEKIQELTKNLQLLQEKVDSMSKSEEQLTTQLDELKEEYNKNVNSTAEIISDTVTSFKNAHDETISEIQEIKDKVSDVVNQMSASTLERVKALEDKFQSVLETSEKYSTEFDELKSKMYTTFVTADALDTIKQKRKNLKENVKTMVTELNGYIENERNERVKSIEEVNSLIDQLNQTMKEASEKADNEAKYNKEQVRKILSKINRISKSKDIGEGGEDQSQGVTVSPELTMDVDELKFKLKQMEEINSKYKDDINDLNKSLQEFTTKMNEQKDDYMNRISNLEYISNSEQKDIMDKILKLEDQFDTTTKSLSDLPSMVMNSNQMNQAAINEFSQHVEDTLTDMKSQLKQATFADDDITELTSKFTAFEEQTNKKHSEVSDKINKIEFELSQRRAAEIEHSKMWAAINDNKVKIDVQLEKTNPQLSSLIAKLKKSQKEIKEIVMKPNEKDIDDTESETEETSAPAPEYTAIIETMRAKITNLEEENRKVGNSVTRIQEEVSVSRDNIDRIAKQIREEVVEMRNKLPESFIETDIFNGLKEEVTNIHDALNTTIETTVSEREKVEEQISEFNSTITSMQSNVKNEVQSALQNALKNSNISSKDINLSATDNNNNNKNKSKGEIKSDEEVDDDDDNNSSNVHTAIIGADDESMNKMNSNEVADLKLMINGIDIALQRQIRKLKISVRNIERMLEDAAEEEKRQQEIEKQKKEKEELAKEIVEEEKKKHEEEMLEEEEEINDDENEVIQLQQQKEINAVQQVALQQVAQPGAVVYVPGDQTNISASGGNFAQHAIITTVRLPTAIELIQDDFNIFFVLMFSVLLYFLVSDLFLS